MKASRVPYSAGPNEVVVRMNDDEADCILGILLNVEGHYGRLGEGSPGRRLIEELQAALGKKVAA